MNEIRTEVTCPYCGIENQVLVSWPWTNHKVVLCDVEEGGCDEYFVAVTSIDVNAEALEIGQPDPGSQVVQFHGQEIILSSELMDHYNSFRGHGELCCLEEAPSSGAACTRASGHQGDHVAHGCDDYICEIW